MKSLDFRRRVGQSLITRGRPPKVGRPLSYAPPVASKKRKFTYSVPQSILKENLGVHWPSYDKNVVVMRHVQRISKRLAPISNVVHVMYSFV